MKRFKVLQEFAINDAEGKLSSYGLEPIQDFDTRDEALTFVSEQTSPEQFVIDDSEADPVFEGDERILEDDEVSFEPYESSYDPDDDDQDDDYYHEEDDDTEDYY